MKSYEQLEKELQTECESMTILQINVLIYLNRLVKFLYKESTNFVITLAPIVYFIISDIQIFRTTSEMFSFLIFCLFIHFLLYNFILKKFIFNNYQKTYIESYYTVEILKEIKESRIKK